MYTLIKSPNIQEKSAGDQREVSHQKVSRGRRLDHSMYFQMKSTFIIIVVSISPIGKGGYFSDKDEEVYATFSKGRMHCCCMRQKHPWENFKNSTTIMTPECLPLRVDQHL